MTNDGGPAFPMGMETPFEYLHQPGMTLRDYFAAAAMQGIITAGAIQPNSMNGWGLVNCRPSNVAGLAYELADAMLKERMKSEIN